MRRFLLTLFLLQVAAVPAARAEERVPAAVRQRHGRPIPLIKAPGRVGVAAAEVVALLDRVYAVDARRVPVYLLDPRDLHRAHALIEGRRTSELVRGFEYRGVVYLDRAQPSYKETLVHELLHALSGRFTREADARGGRHLVEGVTQHLTMSTGTRLRAGGRGTSYGMYVRFAARLGEALGDDLLADCYFRQGYDALERAADRRLGRGRLARAVHHLEADDYRGAVRALGVSSDDPFDAFMAR